MALAAAHSERRDLSHMWLRTMMMMMMMMIIMVMMLMIMVMMLMLMMTDGLQRTSSAEGLFSNRARRGRQWNADD